MKIIENFLTKEEFEPIQSYFFYKLPWMYWNSIVGNMGDEKEESKRLKAFKGFQVNEDLMKHAKTDAIFMHDMPAHRGLEISDSMIDCHNSVVFDQAENRLHAQKAIMAFLFKGEMI